MAGVRWIFTRSQLFETPSRKCGYEYEKELSYRQQGANFIQDMGQRLQVTQLCINTAIVYMHRFYMIHSFSKFHRNSIATACLFLAAKVEEQPRKLEHVIKVSHLCLHRETPDPKSEAYLEQAQELVVNENILLQSLGFEISIDHPHTHVVKTCQLVRASKDLAQTSYFLATNSLHLTNMCLQYKPTVVACVCIHLACKWSNWELPVSSEGKEWFWYVDKDITLLLLEELTQEFLKILDNCPSKLRRKIMNWKSGLRDEESNLMGGAKRLKVDPNLIASTDSEKRLEKVAPPSASAYQDPKKGAYSKELAIHHQAPGAAGMTKDSAAAGLDSKPGPSSSGSSRNLSGDQKRVKQEVSITPEEYRQRREKERQAMHGSSSHRPDSAKHSSSLGKSQSSSNVDRHFSDSLSSKDQRIQHSRPPDPNRDKRRDQHAMRQHGSGRHDMHGMRPDHHHPQSSSAKQRPSGGSQRAPSGGGANGGHAPGQQQQQQHPSQSRALEYSVHNQQHFDKLKQQSRQQEKMAGHMSSSHSSSSSGQHRHGHSTSYHSSLHKSNHLKHPNDPTKSTSSPQLQRKRPHSPPNPSTLQSTSSQAKIARNDSSTSLHTLNIPPPNSAGMSQSIHEALSIDTEAAKSLSANGSSANSPALPGTPTKEHLSQVQLQLQQLIEFQTNKIAAQHHIKPQPPQPGYPAHMRHDQQPPLPPSAPPTHSSHPPLPRGYPPPPPPPGT